MSKFIQQFSPSIYTILSISYISSSLLERNPPQRLPSQNSRSSLENSSLLSPYWHLHLYHFPLFFFLSLVSKSFNSNPHLFSECPIASSSFVIVVITKVNCQSRVYRSDCCVTQSPELK